jgi:hypothetical protein
MTKQLILQILISVLSRKSARQDVTEDTLCNEFKCCNSDLSEIIHDVEQELYLKDIEVKIEVPTINIFNAYTLGEYSEVIFDSLSKA